MACGGAALKRAGGAFGTRMWGGDCACTGTACVYFGGGGPPLAGPASGCEFNVAWPDGIVGVLLALRNAFGNAKSESSGISTCGHMSF